MTLSEALEWIANLFEEAVEKIKPETTRDEIDAWDSLGVLTLIAALDEKFNILMTEKEIGELKKVNDIIDILKRNGKLE